jgi:hypothetical protein
MAARPVQQNLEIRDGPYLRPMAGQLGITVGPARGYEVHLGVAEVKNLSRGPGKDETLQVANYLNPRGAGLFAVIFVPHRP